MNLSPPASDRLNVEVDCLMTNVVGAYAFDLRRRRRAVGLSELYAPVFFHGTSLLRWQKIQSEGLRPSRERAWRTRPAISLASELSYASVYATERVLTREG